MPTITIKNLNNQQLYFENTNNKVLNIIHQHEIDWMHACGKKGRCTTCKMIVHAGLDKLSPLTNFEKHCLELGKLSPVERLSCQCTSQGDITISVPDTGKLPHLNYSS